MKRVRIVRRSWLTPLSMAVRCSVARSIRRFISMKALPACRTSRAPWGLKSRLRPLPKSSAARARRRMGRIWFRRKMIATVSENRRREHSEHEDVSVRLVGERPARDHPEHPVAEIDADFHQARPADRIEPKRLAELGLDLARQRARQRVERAKNELGTAGGRGPAGNTAASMRNRSDAQFAERRRLRPAAAFYRDPSARRRRAPPPRRGGA